MMVNDDNEQEVYFTQSLAATANIEKLAQKKGKNPLSEKFRVLPDDEYPNMYMTREELRLEMNKRSKFYHDTRQRIFSSEEEGGNTTTNNNTKEIGQLRVEILQCFGLPTTGGKLTGEISAYCIAVCGSNAFKTDTMPQVGNPMWLCKMRRSVLFPIIQAYDRLYVGVFDNTKTEPRDEFIGRVVIDIARLRPGCVYDITLPLRQSSHVFTREKRGAIRLRIHLNWNSERAAVTSYLPTSKPNLTRPNTTQQIHCADEKAFRNIAMVVHGMHMPGKFNLTLLKATLREFHFQRIIILRRIMKKGLYDLRYWVYPVISLFVFCSWMHGVYTSSVRYVPGHLVTFLLLHLYKNYAQYCVGNDGSFKSLTIEELLNALLYGRQNAKRSYIHPLRMERDENKNTINPFSTHISFQLEDIGQDFEEDYNELLHDAEGDFIPIHKIGEHMRAGLEVRDYVRFLKKHQNCFLGTDAVDFLVNFGYAKSRDDAVVLGERLQEELRLFQSVYRGFKFDDKPYMYQFLEYDLRTYVIKGKRPLGRSFFRAIGFLKGDSPSQSHIEFPYATEKDHPRFNVKEAVFIRSKTALEEEQQRRQQRKDDELNNDLLEFNFDKDTHEGLVKMFQPNERLSSLSNGPVRGLISSKSFKKTRIPIRMSSLPSKMTESSFDGTTNIDNGSAALNDEKTNYSRYLDTAEYDSDNDGEDIQTKATNDDRYVIEVKTLEKPPSQDVNKKAAQPKEKKESSSSLTKTLFDTRQNAHKKLGHVFHDRVFVIDKTLFPNTLQKSQGGGGGGGEGGGLHGSKSYEEPTEAETAKKLIGWERKDYTPYQHMVDENNKILQINRYSHSNPMISRLGAIFQPLVETVQIGLLLGRSLFNIFTWQDPILSFWFAILGPVLVTMLYLTPFRLVFGILGVILVGPQNWIVRIYKENRYGPPDFDKKIKRKKLHTERVTQYTPGSVFSSSTNENNKLDSDVDPKLLRHVVVPSSVLKYNRFYDWPPESKYSRVYQSSADDFWEAPSITAMTTQSECSSSSIRRRHNAVIGDIKKKKRKLTIWKKRSGK